MSKDDKIAVIYGIDLGKTWFHVIGLDAGGAPVKKAKLNRAGVVAFFVNIPAARVGMEACPGSQWLARKLAQLGHDVRIIPAQFVKPFVKSNKNDTVDAMAIAEAVSRPTMRFVQVKHHEQVELQFLHRSRELLVSTRTRLINQMRAYCLEFGIGMRQGVGCFKASLPGVLADTANDLTPALRELLGDLSRHLGEVEKEIECLNQKIHAAAAASDMARRLASVPGIGALTASAIVAAVGAGKQFKRARDLAAWIGLTPAEYSTGGKTHLMGISKRGNNYLRRLLIHGARSCVMHLDRTNDRLGTWITGLAGRMHHNKVVVALANKLARIAWVILTKPGTLYERRLPQAISAAN
ncbi:IS110 family transposase [Burkholderiaceae bacterium UC74_6]